MGSKPAMAVTALLLMQAAGLYSSIRPEVVPSSAPLADIPTQLSGWQLVQEGVVEPEVQEVLKADDLLNRVYARNNAGVNLFVAAFRTQRTGKAPHSPKNCMPGSGWLPVSSGEIQIDVGKSAPIPVNRYVVAYGQNRSLVLYWYQSRERAVASEYKAKLWVMVDSMRLNRTDTALVRVVVPIANNDEDQAERAATEFVKSFYGTILGHLPA